MNCRDFRRLAYANTETRDPAAVAHAATCEACRGLAAGLRRQDEVLGRALAVPVTPGLADRVLLARRIVRPRARVWALAAGVVMVAAVALVAVWQVSVGRQLGGEMIAHVMAEPESLAAAASLPDERLAAALARAGLGAKGPLGYVRYASQCQMRGGVGQHLVLETSQGRVTIIVAPPGRHARLRQAVARAGYFAEIVPGGLATVGVIGSDREAIRSIAAMIERT